MQTQVAVGQVSAVDAAHNRLTIFFRTGGVLSGVPVNVLYGGYADGLRVRQAPLPQIGTWGLVLFPYGDLRNGFWLGAIYANQSDALMGDENDQHVDYYSHWSGYWRLLNKSGVTAEQWPDQSYAVAGSGGLPATYRHIVDGNEQQQRVAVSFSDRVATPPGPFAFTFSHAAGTTRTYDASGSLTVNGGANAAWEMAFGGTTLQLDKSGNWTLTGKSGGTYKVIFNGGEIQIGTGGGLSFTVPSGQKVNFYGNGSSDQLALVSLLVSAFNSHVHPGDSGGTTGTPKTPWTAAAIASDYFQINT